MVTHQVGDNVLFTLAQSDQRSGTQQIRAMLLVIGGINEMPNIVQQSPDLKQEQVFIGTGVTRSLSARFDKQGDLQKFLAGIKTSNELTIAAVTTELADERKLRAALREKSIESSREKAEVIAKAYGVRLAGVYSVSDVAPQVQYGIQEGTWPSMYEWRQRDGFASLDRIVVTGTRLQTMPAPESMQAGYVNFDDKIYAVFLLAD